MLTADLDFALVFSGLCEIIGKLHRNQVSGVLLPSGQWSVVSD